MKIRVRDIRSNGLELVNQLKVEELGLATEDYISLKDPINVNATVQKAEDTVLATLKLSGQYETYCARCLEPLTKGWQKEFFFDFQVDNNTEYVEVDEDLRQELLLAFPVKILCKEDCQGLCAGCGANLNNQECKCNNK